MSNVGVLGAMFL